MAIPHRASVLKTMESGHPATNHRPSEWLAEVPFFRDVSLRLERAIGPFIPRHTQNDQHFVNIMFSSPSREQIWFIDWDGVPMDIRCGLSGICRFSQRLSTNMTGSCWNAIAANHRPRKWERSFSSIVHSR